MTQSLGILIVTAAALSILLHKVRMPGLVVYMFTGLILGPATGLITSNEMLNLISESGIVLLLFLVGLEISIERVKDIGKIAIIAGGGQVTLTFVLGYILTKALGFSPMDGFYLATAFTFSSTVVVVKLLDQKGDLDKLYGRIAVGIFLVQDIVVIFLLTVLSGIAQIQEPGIIEIAWGSGKALLGLGALLLSVITIARWILPVPFRWASRSADTLFIWSLAWVFAIVLLAELFHLSAEVGAFMAGIALAQHSYAEDLRRRVHPVMNFFIIVFFILLTVRMDFSYLSSQLFDGFIFSIFVLAGKFLIFLLILRRMKYSSRTSFLTSITVAQISEFSFIFAATGIASGKIGPQILSLISLVGIITISISSYLIIYSEKIFKFLVSIKLLSESDDAESEYTDGRSVIVVGMNPLGRAIVDRLVNRGFQVLAIDTDLRKLQGLSCKAMHGNVEYMSTLEEANFKNAELLISALQIEDTNNLLAFHCEKNKVPFAVHASDPSMKDGLLAIGADHIISPKESVILTYQRWLMEEGNL